MITQDRFHALDAARGFALLLGIVLHATMSFFLSFPAQDASQSTTLAVSFYVIHIFRMSMFYVIAGFFAHMVFHRRGARTFLRDRAKRIAVPMIAGWPILAPLTIGIVIRGLSKSFPDGLPGGADAAAPAGFPLTHLWFLYYLCILYVVALTLRSGVVAIDRTGKLRSRLDSIVRRGIATRLAPLALAIPTFGVLFLDAAWPVWFGVPTPDTGLAPKLPALVAYGTAFTLGWILHRQTSILATLERQWLSNIIIAVGLTTMCLSIVGPVPSLLAPSTLEGGAVMRAVYAGGYTLSIWFWTFGLLGASMRFFSGESTVRRYLADSSYWLYLAHLPIVFALQVVLMDVPLHWAVKYPLILAVATTVLLVSYHYLVRPTFIGEILNGRKIPRRKSDHVSRDEAGARTLGTQLPSELTAESRDILATPIAELTGVAKSYGALVALDGVSMQVRPGELLSLLGPNGAGKSTALGLWLGTLEANEGSATIMGGSPLDVHSRLGVGVMMQEVALAPMLSAREHVALASSYYRDPLPVEETLAVTGIESLADKRYGKLSAGQKRQVQFATAICGRPRLLFLDEPTVGLDVAAREAIWRNIRRLVEEGCAIVLTTHYLEEAESLADRVIVLAKGKVIAEGSVDEMRSLVTRSRISCATTVAVEEIRTWPDVVDAECEDSIVHVTASDAETVVRRLLASDQSLSHLQVRQANLAEAFTELTKEAA